MYYNMLLNTANLHFEVESFWKTYLITDLSLPLSPLSMSPLPFPLHTLSLLKEKKKNNFGLWFPLKGPWKPPVLSLQLKGQIT